MTMGAEPDRAGEARRIVDHSQYTVAKPIARPASSRARNCMPSLTGSAISARESASSASSVGETS